MPRPITQKEIKLIAKEFRVLSQPVRLHLLNELRKGEQSVTALVEITGLNQANVSKHLQVLLKNDLVSRERRGQSVFYRIANPIIFELCELMCEKMRSYRKQREPL